MSQESKQVKQPLHPDVRVKLDPEYVAFHDKYMQYVTPDDQKIWDGSARTTPSLPPGGLPPVPVGEVREVQVGIARIRAYYPDGQTPSTGWPVFIWYHGGGWAIGGLDDGKDFCTLVCQEAQCCVITVDYRLAPEHPFPAAVEDSIDVARWVATKPLELGDIDIARVSIGGTSAGANLAIVAALSLIDGHLSFPYAKPRLSAVNYIAPVALVLIVPVVDNTATVDGIWSRNAETAPWLTPARMEWYRKLYFPDEDCRAQWDASPNLAAESLLKKLPRTRVVVAGQDLLAPEGELFAQQLEALGRDVELVTVVGATHSILTLGGVMQQSKEMMEDTARYLTRVFKGGVKTI